MNNEEGKIYYGLGIDNSQLEADAAKSMALFRSIGNQSVAEGARIDNSYKRATKSMALIGGAAAFGALTKELYTFANAFDNSMKEVSTLSSTVADDLDGFKQSVLNMADIPILANDAAKALYQIVSAGHDGANGLNVLEVSAKAAVGGITQAVTAADGITSILNAYKKSSSEAMSVSDQMFTAVRLGKTTFGELGSSISQVVPIAASFGIESEQILAAVATLTKSGTPTAQAMTQIRASIQAASKVLGDGYFATHTFQEGLAEIASRANGSEAGLRKLVPEIEAMNAVLGLTGINAKMAASDLTALEGSLGATEQAFAKMSNTADAQISILKNKILAKFHAIGEGAVDMVGSAATFLNSDGIFNTTALDDLIATMGFLIATTGAYKAAITTKNAISAATNTLRLTEEAAELSKLLTIEQRAKISKLNLTKASAEYAAVVKDEVAAEIEKQVSIAKTTNIELSAAKERLTIAKVNKIRAAENITRIEQELAATVSSATAEQMASFQNKSALESEKQSHIALSIVKMEAQKDTLIEQAIHLKEVSTSGEIIQLKNREIAAISSKISTARQEQIQCSKNVVAIRAEQKAILNNVTSKKIANIESKLAVAQQHLETVTINKNTISREVSSKRAILDSAVRNSNTLATGLNTAATVGNTSATTILSIAKVKLAAITAKVNAVILANPYTIAAAAVVALTYGVYKLATHQTAAEKSQAKLNETVKKSETAITAERYQIDLMFARLQAAKKGTEEYNAAKQAILSQYGSYLTKLGDEKTALNDIAAAYTLITEEAAKAARARAMETATKDAADTIAEQEGDTYDEIKELIEAKFKGQKGTDGKDLSATYLMKIKPVIAGTSEITPELEKIIKQFDEQHYARYEKGVKIQNAYISNNILSELRSLDKGRVIYKKTMDDALLKFGEVPKSIEEGGAKEEFDATKLSLQQLMNELPNAISQLDTLRKAGNSKPEDIAAQTDKTNSIKAQITARETELKIIRDVEAQIELLQKEKLNYAKSDNEYKSLDTRIKSLKKKLPQQGHSGSYSTPKDYADKIKQEKQEKERMSTDLVHSVQQAEINAMSEGLDKVLAQNELNHAKELVQIKRQKEDKLSKIQEWERTIWESQNPYWEDDGKKFIPKTTVLSNDENSNFGAIEDTATTILATNNKKAYETALNDYTEFANSYIDKVSDFDDNLKTLGEKHKHDRTALVNSGASEAEIKKFDQQAKQEVAAVTDVQQELMTGLDEQMEMKNQTFLTFVEQIANMGIAELKLKLDEAELLLASAQATSKGTGDESTVIEYQAQIKTLKQQIVALSNKSDKKESKESGDPLAKYKAALKTVNKLGAAANDIAKAFAGLDGDIFDVMDSIGSMSSAVGSMLKTIVLMSASSQLSIAGTSVAANTAITSTSLLSAEAIKTVEKASVILAIIGAALQIATAIAQVLTNVFSKDKKREKEIQQLQGQVDNLDASYENLGNSIDKAYSYNASALIRQQDEALRKQNELIAEQKRIEESKKKPDTDAIDQYNDKIEENNKILEENKEKAVDSIFGSDVKSAIDEFADAYVDAWASGEDKAASMKDVVKNMIKGVITEIIKTNLAPTVKDLRERIAAALKDGVITAEEEADIDALVNKAYKDAEASYDPSLDKYIKDEETEERESSKQGFGSMSQDSADELNGRFTALQALTSEINEGMKTLRANSQTIITILTGIESNTGRLEAIEEHISGVEETVHDVKKGIDSINDKGIILRR